MRLRISRGLTERPVQEANLLQFLNRELIPIVREMLRAVSKAPGPFSWSGGQASVDLLGAHDFSASNTLTQNSTLLLSNGYEGAEGTIYVQQDAVGGWTMTVTADGRTILRDDPFADDNPSPGPGDLTRYHYTFITVAGTPYVVLERSFLL